MTVDFKHLGCHGKIWGIESSKWIYKMVPGISKKEETIILGKILLDFLSLPYRKHLNFKYDSNVRNPCYSKESTLLIWLGPYRCCLFALMLFLLVWVTQVIVSSALSRCCFPTSTWLFSSKGKCSHVCTFHFSSASLLHKQQIVLFS